MNNIITDYPAYFTATNLEWKKLLEPDKYKMIVVDSLRFLVEDQRIILYAFVIMWNHIHLIWQMQANREPDDVQRDFLKYTSQKIKADLKLTNPVFLEEFRVDAIDRTYQLWERNPLSIDLWSHSVFLQKLNYIHWNPVRAGICRWPEEYLYSSARFYETGMIEHGERLVLPGFLNCKTH
jgi:putative transposase